LNIGVPSAGTPFGVRLRSSAEGEARRREEPQFIIQQLARPKKEDEDFNSSLGPVSLTGTITFIFLLEKE